MHAGRPPHEPDQPLNAPITMASTYVAGGEREYGRYGNPTWTAFEDALGALEGGRALAFASGIAAVSTVLDLVANGARSWRRGISYNGTLLQLADLESRGRVTTVARRHRPTPTGSSPRLRRRRPGLARVADQPGARARRHRDRSPRPRTRPARTSSSTTPSPLPCSSSRSTLGADLVVHSATKYLAGHSDVLMGAVVAADDALCDALKGRRDLLGAIPGTFEAWLALRGLRTLHVRIERAQANAAELARRLADHPAVEEVRYPGFGAIVAIVLAGGADAADLLVRTTRLWVHATWLGGVESTLERRRRWKAEPATIPDGLVRLSVGIEDVEDLWADLEQALDDLSR